MRTALRIKFPDHHGKYREFHRFWTLLCYVSHQKPQRSPRLFGEFPKIWNRELILKNREGFLVIRELNEAIKEIESRVSFWEMLWRDRWRCAHQMPMTIARIAVVRRINIMGASVLSLLYLDPSRRSERSRSVLNLPCDRHRCYFDI